MRNVWLDDCDPPRLNQHFCKFGYAGMTKTQWVVLKILFFWKFLMRWGNLMSHGGCRVFCVSDRNSASSTCKMILLTALVSVMLCLCIVYYELTCVGRTRWVFRVRNASRRYVISFIIFISATWTFLCNWIWGIVCWCVLECFTNHNVQSLTVLSIQWIFLLNIILNKIFSK